MTSLTVGLALAALALLIQRLHLRGPARRLKQDQQAFRFHALRDELQNLAIAGELDRTSETYRFTSFALNFAIRNAGEVRIRDTLRTAKKVDPEGQVPFWREVMEQPEEVRQVVGGTFEAYTTMLIENDKLVALGYFLRRRARGAIRKALAWVNRLIEKLTPKRAEAAAWAERYREYGARLSHSH